MWLNPNTRLFSTDDSSGERSKAAPLANLRGALIWYLAKPRRESGAAFLEGKQRGE